MNISTPYVSGYVGCALAKLFVNVASTQAASPCMCPETRKPRVVHALRTGGCGERLQQVDARVAAKGKWTRVHCWMVRDRLFIRQGRVHFVRPDCRNVLSACTPSPWREKGRIELLLECPPSG